MATITVGKVALTPKGEYDESTTYERMDIVSYNGASYIILKDETIGITPEEGNYYHLMADKGEDGASAYEVAVDEGYAGTEEQWLASLKGDSGEAATVSIGTVTSGDTASVVNSGTEAAAVFDFVLPKGDIYTLTDEDKSDIADLVYAMFENGDEVSY